MASKNEFKVAIIGAGIGGASAAYFLRTMFNEQVDITIYEKSGEIGGRIKSIDFAAQRCEAGALAIHSSNKYIMNFAKQCDLPLQNMSKADQRTVVLSDTNRAIFSSLEGCRVMAFGTTAWRYGVDLVRIRSYVKSVVKDFARIYRLQDEGHCFTTPARLLNAIKPEFVEMTTHTYDDWLRTKLRLNSNFRDELAYGLINFHYCQGLDAHAFVGLLSLVASIPEIYSVGTGNQQVPQKLIQKALSGNSKVENQTIIHANVKKIEHVDQSHKYQLTFEDSKTGNTNSEEYDYVIIACPLNQVSRLEYFSDKPLPTTSFVEVDRVLYTGKLRRNDTSLRPEWCEKKQWIAVLRAKSETPNTNIPWGMMHMPMQQSQTLGFKMIWLANTNPKSIPNPGTRIQELYFEKTANTSVKTDANYKIFHWHAFPVYNKVDEPEHDLGSFVIAPGLFYLNALESAASTMEMSAIAGRNVALLVANSRKSTLVESDTKTWEIKVQLDQFEQPQASSENNWN